MKLLNLIRTGFSINFRRIPERHRILILALLVGLLSGFSAVIIKNTVHITKTLLTWSFVKEYENYLYFLYPLIGLFLTVLFVKYIVKNPIGHGVPNVLYAISKNKSIIKAQAMFASIIASSLTVGFGGSVGLEGPTVSTSSAVGSNIAQFFKQNYKTTTLLLGCGAAGAMSGIFNAPIAALVFVLEVFMFDLTLTSMIPFLAASVAAALSSRMMLGNNVLFDIKINHVFIASNVPFYILLGVFTGLVSAYFNKIFTTIEAFFEKIKQKRVKLIFGGTMLGVLIFFVPPLYGEGFETIIALLNNRPEEIFNNSMFYEHQTNIILILVLLTGIIFLKVIASAITFGAGGVGGVFAPSLFMGATSGFVFAKSINYFAGTELPLTNFSLVGMAGLIAGVLHAPLTALFLIAEITKGYELMIPLMITAAISYITSKYFVEHSVYTHELAKRGELLTRNKDKTILTLMNLNDEIENDFINMLPQQKLGDLVKVVSVSSRNLFPVVDEKGVLQGIITLDDFREIMFKPELYETITVESLMTLPPGYIFLSDNMDAVMDKFSQSNAWNLPVIDGEKYIGFVSKAKLFNAYRKELMRFSEE